MTVPVEAPSGPQAPLDRPPARERLLSQGPSTLTTAELVALLLGSGGSGRVSERVATDVLASAGSLRALASGTPAELANVPGLGASRAARLLAALELGRRTAAEPLVRGSAIRAAADVFRHYHPLLRDLRFEQFRIVLLDGKHRILREVLVSQGTLTSSPVHPREVFAAAIRHSAAAVILVHNHPSGDPAPSADDVEITRRLAQVGDLVGIRVLDHVIVGDGAYASLADRGLMG
jgi:DNA repair protein RadC